MNRLLRVEFIYWFFHTFFGWCISWLIAGYLLTEIFCTQNTPRMRVEETSIFFSFANRFFRSHLRPILDRVLCPERLCELWVSMWSGTQMKCQNAGLEKLQANFEAESELSGHLSNIRCGMSDHFLFRNRKICFWLIPILFQSNRIIKAQFFCKFNQIEIELSFFLSDICWKCEPNIITIIHTKRIQYNSTLLSLSYDNHHSLLYS